MKKIVWCLLLFSIGNSTQAMVPHRSLQRSPGAVEIFCLLTAITDELIQEIGVDIQKKLNGVQSPVVTHQRESRNAWYNRSNYRMP